jgi:hypothetical protein
MAYLIRVRDSKVALRTRNNVGIKTVKTTNIKKKKGGDKKISPMCSIVV